MEPIMQTVYDFLLDEVLGHGNGNGNDSGPASLSSSNFQKPSSLIRNALKKHLQIYLPTRAGSNSLDVKPVWSPNYSAAQLLHPNSIEILMSILAMTKPFIQEQICTVLLKLLDSNPVNKIIFSRNKLQVI
jgi:hypothetical protein